MESLYEVSVAPLHVCMLAALITQSTVDSSVRCINSKVNWSSGMGLTVKHTVDYKVVDHVVILSHFTVTHYS